MNTAPPSRVLWKDVPTRTTTAGGMTFAFRELGTENRARPSFA